MEANPRLLRERGVLLQLPPDHELFDVVDLGKEGGGGEKRLAYVENVCHIDHPKGMRYTFDNEVLHLLSWHDMVAQLDGPITRIVVHGTGDENNKPQSQFGGVRVREHTQV